MPKKTTKNCGWARKLLRQHSRATSAVKAATHAHCVRADTRICRGNRPSGNRITAHMYATPETMWNMKCTAATGHGFPRMWNARWLGRLKVAAVPSNAKPSSRGTVSSGRRSTSSSPSATLRALNRYCTIVWLIDVVSAIVSGCSTRAASRPNAESWVAALASWSVQEADVHRDERQQAEQQPDQQSGNVEGDRDPERDALSAPVDHDRSFSPRRAVSEMPRPVRGEMPLTGRRTVSTSRRRQERPILVAAAVVVVLLDAGARPW